LFVSSGTCEHIQQTAPAIKLHATSVLVQSAIFIIKTGAFLFTVEKRKHIPYFCVCTGQMAWMWVKRTAAWPKRGKPKAKLLWALLLCKVSYNRILHTKHWTPYRWEFAMWVASHKFHFLFSFYSIQSGMWSQLWLIRHLLSASSCVEHMCAAAVTPWLQFWQTMTLLHDPWDCVPQGDCIHQQLLSHWLQHVTAKVATAVELVKSLQLLESAVVEGWTATWVVLRTSLPGRKLACIARTWCLLAKPILKVLIALWILLVLLLLWLSLVIHCHHTASCKLGHLEFSW